MSQYPVLNLEELHELLLADASNRFDGEISLSPRGEAYIRLRVTSGAVVDVHAHVAAQGRALAPWSAIGQALNDWLKLKGTERRGATKATAKEAYRVFGEAEQALPSGQIVVHPSSGRRYELGTGTVPEGGSSVDVDITAVTPGSASRLSSGEELQFENTPSGFEETGQLVKSMSGGLDREEEGDARDRLLTRFSDPPRGGANADYRDWVRGDLRDVEPTELQGQIASVHVYPNRHGRGAVDVAALKAGEGTARILSAGERADLLEILAGFVNANLDPDKDTIRVLETTATTQAVKARIRPKNGPENEFDWNDSSPPVIASWAPSTRTLTFEADRPETMRPGDRFSIDAADEDATGEQLVIESLSGTGAVVIREAPEGWSPAAGDTVYAGGPLVDVVRDAILKHLNTEIGPTVGDFGFGDWEGALRTSKLFRLIQNSEGVLDSELEDPTDTVELDDTEFPDNGSVPLIVPGQILVRRWWV